MEPDAGVRNVYTGSDYAEEYAELGWNGTYYLVRRDLPGILQEHVPMGKALDFGCGSGRSTRLLRELGYQVIGIDVSEAMIAQARQLDPDQDYRVIEDGDFSELPSAGFDLVLACFPFDNIAGRERKIELFRGLGKLLRDGGRFVNIVSSPELYIHEWASFTTAPFKQNRHARSGDVVQIVTKDFAEGHVCNDVLWDDASYRDTYEAAGLEIVASYRPLGRAEDPVHWVSEQTVAPWVFWVLAKAKSL